MANAAVCCLCGSRQGFIARCSANKIMDKPALLVWEEKAIWHGSAATERGVEVGEMLGARPHQQRNQRQIHGEDQSRRTAVPTARPCSWSSDMGKAAVRMDGQTDGEA